MRLSIRSKALFFLLALLVGCASMDGPVSPSDRQALESLGISHGQEYTAAKSRLLASGWVLQEDWAYFDDPKGKPQPGTRGYYPMGYGVEFACGAETCSAKFNQGSRSIILVVYPRGRQLLVDRLL